MYAFKNELLIVVDGLYNLVVIELFVLQFDHTKLKQFNYVSCKNY